MSFTINRETGLKPFNGCCAMTESRTRNEHGLTERQELFCHEFVNSGNQKEKSAIAAGYGEAGARTRAYEMLQQDKILSRIRDLTHKMLQATGSAAIKTLEDLMKNARSESVRQGCAIALVDRAGYAHAQVIEIDDKRDISEIDKELEDLLREAGKGAEQVIRNSEKVLN